MNKVLQQFKDKMQHSEQYDEEHTIYIVWDNL